MKESPTSVQRPANWSCQRMGGLGSSTTRPNLTTLTGGSPTLTQERPGLASKAQASSRGGFPSSVRAGAKNIKTELKTKPSHAHVRRALARERRPVACSEAAKGNRKRQTDPQKCPAAPEGQASPGSPGPLRWAFLGGRPNPVGPRPSAN